MDTTSYSLSGQYEPRESEEGEENIPITITHGYNKDHRSDVQEMIVSKDSGIPLHCENWDGNSSDNVIFRQRAETMIDSFKASDSEQFCVANSKLYHKKNAEFLRQINFITLVPSTIQLEKISIAKALKANDWHIIEKQYCAIKVKHMDIAQRWLVVHSQAARTYEQESGCQLGIE